MMKSGNLLHKWGFVKTQSLRTVCTILSIDLVKNEEFWIFSQYE